MQQGCCKVDASSPKTWHMYFTLKCLYETGKGHTNLIKMLMSFAKITYLFDTKKSHIIASFMDILLCN